MDRLTHQEVQQLTRPERLELISQLWESLEADDVPLIASHTAELDRRLATLDRDRSSGVTWAELRAELEKRCS